MRSCRQFIIRNNTSNKISIYVFTFSKSNRNIQVKMLTFSTKHAVQKIMWRVMSPLLHSQEKKGKQGRTLIRNWRLMRNKEFLERTRKHVSTRWINLPLITRLWECDTRKSKKIFKEGPKVTFEHFKIQHNTREVESTRETLMQI